MLLLCAQEYKVSARNLVEKYFPQYKKGEGMFERDGRGTHTRDYVLGEEDLLARFTGYMRYEKCKPQPCCPCTFAPLLLLIFSLATAGAHRSDD